MENKLLANTRVSPKCPECNHIAIKDIMRVDAKFNCSNCGVELVYLQRANQCIFANKQW